MLYFFDHNIEESKIMFLNINKIAVGGVNRFLADATLKVTQ